MSLPIFCINATSDKGNIFVNHTQIWLWIKNFITWTAVSTVSRQSENWHRAKTTHCQFYMIFSDSVTYYGMRSSIRPKNRGISYYLIMSYMFQICVIYVFIYAFFICEKDILSKTCLQYHHLNISFYWSIWVI